MRGLGGQQENPDGIKQLTSLIKAFVAPHKVLSVPQLPKTALSVSGKTYIFDDNPLNFKTISLTFNTLKDEAQLNISYKNQHITAAIGLDNIFRFTLVDGHLRGYKGFWKNDNLFVINFHDLNEIDNGKLNITFKHNTVRILFHNNISHTKKELIGRVQD